MERHAVTARSREGESVEIALEVVPATPWRLVATLPDGSELDAIAKGDDDVFECFLAVRRQLEARGLMLCCAGARRGVWPSGDVRRLSGGRRAYVLPQHRAPEERDVVEIFDPADCATCVTVAEQVASVRDRYRHRDDEPSPRAMQLFVDTLRGLFGRGRDAT